ncbi:MAG: hypothetical protein H6673_09960 [Anaerolineales bacterium]|nr:hypothetical protein [Anaerolineales bacterium]
MNNRWLVPVAVILLLAGLVGFVVVTVTGAVQESDSREYKIVIPAGTGDRIAAGETVDIIPDEIHLKLGKQDILVIENHDSTGHRISDFWVGAGETLRQEFHTPAVYHGECTVHQHAQIQIIITQ